MRSLLLLLAVTAVARADWPQYRGAKRDGHATATFPATWPATMPVPVWTRSVGEGQGGVAVAGGRVYVIGRMKNEEVATALDAVTGELKWEKAEPVDYKAPDPSAGDCPRTTPCVDGDRAYFLGVAGALVCRDLKTGKPLWQHALKREFWGVEKDKDGDDAWAPPCGCATCPLIDGKQIILSVGGKKAGTLTAFDRATGSILWRSPEKDRGSYSSPIVATVGGTRQVVAFTGLRLGGFTPAGGKPLWDRPFKAKFEQTILTPIAYKDTVIYGGEGRATIALKVAGGKVTQAWTNDDLKAYTTTPVVFGNHLVGLNSRGDLVCVNADDGKTAWVRKAVSNYHGSLVVADKRVLLLTSRGELLVFAADPTKFTQEAKWKVSENTPCWGHLAVDGPRVFVRDKTDVLCYTVR
jgi:outer membrane protein assembly factor BamB